MPRRAGGFVRGRGGGRLASSWTYGTNGVSVVIPGVSKVLLGTFTPVGGFDLTVLRTRGMIYFTSDQAAAQEDLAGAFGLIVVSSDANAAGAASIPGPVSDGANDGWFVHQPFVGRAADGVGFAQSAPTSVQYDSKAMRKIPAGFVVAIMVENELATGLRFNWTARILEKLTQAS